MGTGTVVLTPDVVVSTSDFYRLGDDADVSRLSPDDLCSVSTRLERAHCADFEEEFRVLLSFVCQTAIPGNGRRYHRRLLTCLRKFAHRKYREQFFGAVAELRREVNRRPEELARVGIGLERIVDQAALRFGP